MRGTTTSTLLPYTTLFRSREAGAVLEGLELGLGVGGVIGDVRAGVGLGDAEVGEQERDRLGGHRGSPVDRKSTRLNSSHSQISYAVFCLKKKIGRGVAGFD